MLVHCHLLQIPSNSKILTYNFLMVLISYNLGKNPLKCNQELSNHMWLCLLFFSFYMWFLWINLWWPLFVFCGFFFRDIFSSWFSPSCCQGAGLMCSLDFAHHQHPVIFLAGVFLCVGMFASPCLGAFSISL